MTFSIKIANILQDVRFQFMNTARILEKQLNMTYSHMTSENRTILDRGLVLDPNNKISANYVLDSKNQKLKYSYMHEGLATFEPCYDFEKNSWKLAVSKSVLDGDVIRASCEMSRKVLGLDWLFKSSLNRDGRCKVSASFSLVEGFQLRMPTLTAESWWNFKM